MRTPAFWNTDPATPAWQARLLSPLGKLYAKATARRLAQGKPTALDVPVVCIGNINAGGTGKTPTVIAVTEKLRDLYHKPHIVTRGYGGTHKGPVLVNPAKHSAKRVGDEPLLLSAFADVWVARDRAAGALAAQQAGASVIIMDDGHQNPSLGKDLTIVVVDAATGFGNAKCLPAGPLREPVETGLARADMILSIGPKAQQNRFNPPTTLPHLRAELKPLQTGMDWKDTPVYAFAGIGRPQKFFDTLRELGANILHEEPLGDHQALSTTLLSRLDADARARGAQLVTTEKDAARLPPAYRSKVITLPVRLYFDNSESLDTALKALPKP